MPNAGALRGACPSVGTFASPSTCQKGRPKEHQHSAWHLHASDRDAGPSAPGEGLQYLLTRGMEARSGRNAGVVAAAPAALAAMVLVGGRSSSGGADLRQRPDRNRTHTVGRQQEFAREQARAALTVAVIDDTVEADRRGFGGTGRIDVRDRASNRRRVRHARFLVEKPLELGAAHDRARADLDRLDAAIADQRDKGALWRCGDSGRPH